MGLWKTLTGQVVINEVEDEEEILGEEDKKKKKKKKKKKGDGGGGGGGGGGEVEMTFEERQEKRAELKYKRDPTCTDRLVFGKKVRMAYMVILCVLLGLVLPYLLAVLVFEEKAIQDKGYCGLNISWRFDCVPGINVNDVECHRRGCCYDLNLVDLYAPLCFHSVPAEYGYTVMERNTTSGLRTLPTVHDLGNQTEMTLRLDFKRNETNFNTPALTPLQVKVQRQGNDVVRVLLWNSEQVVDDAGFTVQEPDENMQFDINVSEVGQDFSITITRKATGEKVFETVFGPLIYSQEYMEITTRLPTTDIYGLGQRDNLELIPTFKERPRWGLYNREYDLNTGATFSSFPYYMNFEKSGHMYGVYLHNAAPVELNILPIPALAFRVIGGVFDFRIFAGPTPLDVTQQYTQMVGRPAMPPFWALGYHLCRTSMGKYDKDLSHYDQVVEGMNISGIPYESDCIDARLSYPDALMPLSEEVQIRVDELKGAGRKWLMVQYPFLEHDSPAYQTCSGAGALMEHNTTIPYYGKIDGTSVGYPDYLSDSAGAWLEGHLDTLDLYEQADGIMLLRNTPLNEVKLNYLWQDNCTANAPERCCPFTYNPFLPDLITDPNNRTLCSTLLHHDTNVTHLQVHNAYGYYHHKRVLQAYKTINSNTRAFITSQATAPGSGQLGGHFGGNTLPDLASQKKSLIQVLEMGLSGVSAVGFPACGSVDSAVGATLKTEWCLRSHQVSSFWPLMVSHYEADQTPRNPPDFDLTFSKELRPYVRQRYMFLPYLYTLYHQAHTTGAPLVRPLFYHFPHDQGARNVSDQFLLGEGLLVCPAFQPVGSHTSVTLNVHFPPGCWYNYYTGSLMANGNNGTNIDLPTLITDINVFIRGGTILPLQGDLHYLVSTTEESRQQPHYLLVALTCQGTYENDTIEAKGSLYVDDGITPLDDPTFEYQLLDLTATDHNLTVALNEHGAENATGCSDGLEEFSTVIDIVRVFGIPFSVVEVQVDNANTEFEFLTEPDTGALRIARLEYNWCLTEGPLTITWN